MSSRQFAAAKFSWIERIARDHKILPIDVRVAVALLSYFNEKDQGGRAFPSCKFIGNQIGASEPTVIRAVHRLHTEGHLRATWGQQGRGHPNNYWMQEKPSPTKVFEPVKPSPAQVKKPPRMKVSETVKPPSVQNKTSADGGDSQSKLSREGCAPPKGGSAPLKGSKQNVGGAPSARRPQGGRAHAGAGPPAAERLEGGAPILDGEIFGPEDSGARTDTPSSAEIETAWKRLRDEIYARGHDSDDTLTALRRDRRAFDAACERASLATIFAGAQTWRAAYSDKPGALMKLSEWLDEDFWRKPPKRKQCKPREQRASGGPRPYQKNQHWKSSGSRQKQPSPSSHMFARAEQAYQERKDKERGDD